MAASLTADSHVTKPSFRIVRYLWALCVVLSLVLFSYAFYQYLRDADQGCLCAVVNIQHDAQGFWVSPAADTPLQQREQLIAIDGSSLETFPDMLAARNLIQGNIGTPVTLTLRNTTGVTHDLTITRVPDLTLQDTTAVGFSLPASIAYAVGTDIVLMVAVLCTAALMISRRPNDWFVLVMAWNLIFYYSGQTNAALHLNLIYQSEDRLWLLPQVLYFIADIGVSFGIVTFPAGNIKPRWTIIVWLLTVLLDAYIIFTNNATYFLLFIENIPLLLVSIYRYRYVLSKVERQQTKLAVLGLVVIMGVTIILSAFADASSWERIPSNAVFTVGLPFYAKLLVNLSFVVFLISVTLAMIRSHLWGVDIVINRSLVYGGVTFALGVIFLVGLYALQNLLQMILGGEQTALAATLSTGIVVMLFNPVRRRVRRFIDRRIYGFRFDLDALKQGEVLPQIKNPGELTGKTIAGFHILGLLGTGAMGEVYQAQADGRQAAIKVIPALLSQDHDFRKRLEREAQALASLKHPHIVQYYGSGEIDSMYFLVLEFIHGADLKRILAEHGKYDWEQARAWIEDIAAALDYIHQRGLVHRDIKPSNIMLRRNSETQNDDAVLMDFGIAKHHSANTQLTAVGSFMGTIDYMAPEQIMAAQEVDQRADIYALGIVLYELLTGERPFSGSAAQILFAHREQPAPNPRDVNPQIPVHVALALLKALEKQPEDRHASAGAFLQALCEENYADGASIVLI